MSFMGGGAECSTASNPLNQMKNHMQDDKSLQRDRMAARGPGAAAGFRSANPAAPQDEVSTASQVHDGREKDMMVLTALRPR